MKPGQRPRWCQSARSCGAVLPGQILRARIILSQPWLECRAAPELLLRARDFRDLQQLLLDQVRQAGLAPPGQALTPGHGFDRKIEILARFRAYRMAAMRMESRPQDVSARRTPGRNTGCCRGARSSLWTNRTACSSLRLASSRGASGLSRRYCAEGKSKVTRKAGCV